MREKLKRKGSIALTILTHVPPFLQALRVQGIPLGDLGPQLEAAVVCCTVAVGVGRIEIDGTEVLWEADGDIESNGSVR